VVTQKSLCLWVWPHCVRKSCLLLECLQAAILSPAQKAKGGLNPWRRSKTYDIFEVMIYSRRHVFISRPEFGEYLVISALPQMVDVARFRASDSELMSTAYVERSAQALGLFDGKGWHLAKLATWLENDLRTCPVCGRAVTSKRATYDRAKCRQAAYRKRRT